jgi:hypothetical protein
MRWWVLRTRPRAEKALVRRLWRRQCSFFLPLYHERGQTAGGSLSSYLPLFKGYVFLHGDSEARLQALKSNLMTECLWVEDQQQLRSDLARIYRCIATGLPLSPEPRLAPATWVEITRGALKGTRGKVSERGRSLKFIVEVHFLLQGLSLEVDSRMIQPVNQLSE